MAKELGCLLLVCALTIPAIGVEWRLMRRIESFLRALRSLWKRQDSTDYFPTGQRGHELKLLRTRRDALHFQVIYENPPAIGTFYLKQPLNERTLLLVVRVGGLVAGLSTHLDPIPTLVDQTLELALFLSDLQAGHVANTADAAILIGGHHLLLVKHDRHFVLMHRPVTS